jgi:hypothetical protein
MFERIGRLAEQTAEGLSRRSFLTRMGLGALAVATFVTGAYADGGSGCILNGGCCGGNVPYAKIVNGVPNVCCKDARCNGLSSGCSGCAASTCCGGSGACLGGRTCYKDHVCNTPC